MRRKSTFYGPEDYYKILNRCGRVKILGKDWKIFNYRHLAESALWKNVTFGIRDSRIWKFKPKSRTFTVSNVYCNGAMTTEVKRLLNEKLENGEISLGGLRLTIPKLETHVTHSKKADVEKLLQYIPEENRTFFNDALKKSVPDKKKKVTEPKLKPVKSLPPSASTSKFIEKPVAKPGRKRKEPSVTESVEEPPVPQSAEEPVKKRGSKVKGMNN